jgi:uncharacterized protein (DUF849 family)
MVTCVCGLARKGIRIGSEDALALPDGLTAPSSEAFVRAAPTPVER